MLDIPYHTLYIMNDVYSSHHKLLWFYSSSRFSVVVVAMTLGLSRCRQSDVAPELVFFWQVIGKCPFGRDFQVSPEVDASKTPKIYDRTFKKYIKIRLWMSQFVGMFCLQVLVLLDSTIRQQQHGAISISESLAQWVYCT